MNINDMWRKSEGCQISWLNRSQSQEIADTVLDSLDDEENNIGIHETDTLDQLMIISEEES